MIEWAVPVGALVKRAGVAKHEQAATALVDRAAGQLGLPGACATGWVLPLPAGSYQPMTPSPGVAPLSAQRWFMEHSRDH